MGNVLMTERRKMTIGLSVSAALALGFTVLGLWLGGVFEATPAEQRWTRTGQRAEGSAQSSYRLYPRCGTPATPLCQMPQNDVEMMSPEEAQKICVKGMGACRPLVCDDRGCAPLEIDVNALSLWGGKGSSAYVLQPQN